MITNKNYLQLSVYLTFMFILLNPNIVFTHPDEPNVNSATIQTKPNKHLTAEDLQLLYQLQQQLELQNAEEEQAQKLTKQQQGLNLGQNLQNGGPNLEQIQLNQAGNNVAGGNIEEVQQLNITKQVQTQEVESESISIKLASSSNVTSIPRRKSKLIFTTSTSTTPPPVEPPVKLTFMLSARNLHALQSLSYTAPSPPSIQMNTLAQIYYSSATSDLHLLETEVIPHNSNPRWNKLFSFIWVKGSGQVWSIKIKARNPPSPDQILAEFTLDVDEYVQIGESLALGLVKPNGEGDQGLIVVDTAQVRGYKEALLQIQKTSTLKIKVSARNLAHRDSFNGKSDPYLIAYWRRSVDGPDVKFGRTGIINNVEDVSWNDVLTFEFYQENSDQYFVFKVYDDDGFSNDEFLGQAFIKIDSLVLGGQRTIDLTNEAGGRRPGDRITGSLTAVVARGE